MAGLDDMRPRSELDIAQLKFEMRQMYRAIGFWCCLRVLTDMLIGARVLSEVIVEESRRERETN